MSKMTGLKELFHSEIGKIHSQTDCAVAAIHCMLINEGLECLGIGEKSEGLYASKDVQKPRLLPEKWNDNQEHYVLRYASKDRWNKYLLKMTPNEKKVNVSITVNDDVYELYLNLDDFIAGNYDQFQASYINLHGLANIVETRLLSRMRRDRLLGNRDSSTNKRASKTPNLDGTPPTAGSSNPKADVLAPSKNSPMEVVYTAKTNNPNIKNTAADAMSRRNPRDSKTPFDFNILPKIGGKDLDPLGRGQGTMHFDAYDLETNPRHTRNTRSNFPEYTTEAGHNAFSPILGPTECKPNPKYSKPSDDLNPF